VYKRQDVGSTVDVSWSASWASLLTLTLEDTVTKQTTTVQLATQEGTYSFEPEHDTEVTLSAEGYQAPDPLTATVNVKAALDFTITPSEGVAPGDTVTLSWTTAGMTSMTLTFLYNPTTTPNQNFMYAVPADDVASGSYAFTASNTVDVFITDEGIGTLPPYEQYTIDVTGAPTLTASISGSGNDATLEWQGTNIDGGEAYLDGANRTPIASYTGTGGSTGVTYSGSDPYGFVVSGNPTNKNCHAVQVEVGGANESRRSQELLSKTS